MQRDCRSNRRAGFTLIELIVVISIIVILMGLTANAVFRVQQSQQRKFTETQIEKLMTAFDQQWKSVIEQARKEPMIDKEQPNPTFNTATGLWSNDWSDAIMQWAGSDTARARALWVRLRLWQEFPHQFEEVYLGAVGTAYSIASAPAELTLPQQINPALPIVYLYSKKTYRDALLAANAVHTSDPGIVSQSVFNLESAVLLYQILSTNRGGMNVDIDALGASAVTDYNLGGANFKVFKDTWGTPIAFRRFGTNSVHGGNTHTYGSGPPTANYSYSTDSDLGELNSPPYVKTGAVSNDPLDPEGKLRTDWSNGRNIPRTLFTQIHADFFARKNGIDTNIIQGFPNMNMAPMIYSAGPDKLFHSDYYSYLPNKKLDPANSDLGTSRSTANDDIVSYRLRRTGQRGD